MRRESLHVENLSITRLREFRLKFIEVYRIAEKCEPVIGDTRFTRVSVISRGNMMLKAGTHLAKRIEFHSKSFKMLYSQQLFNGQQLSYIQHAMVHISVSDWCIRCLLAGSVSTW